MTLGEVECIEWDEGNSDHVSRRGITYSEVAEVVATAFVQVRLRRSGEPRYKVIGFGKGGACLSIVFAYDERRRALRPITGWATTQADRTKYLG